MPSDVRLMPGQLFAKRYEVMRLLGQGTMGAVYEVVDKTEGGRLALKLMNPTLLDDNPKFGERFEQEARIASEIQSDRIVQVKGSGLEEASGVPWLVMEYLEGLELGAYLNLCPSPPADVTHPVLEQLFGAIAAAHAAGVVHRDLKPENVFLTGARPDGTFDKPLGVKVLDFGVAKVVRESTHSGTAAGLGTPLWTAPEQGKEGQVIRPNADVWALGLITFRVLSGKNFWKSANDAKSSAFDVAMELLRGGIPRASERVVEVRGAPLPADFDAWFGRCVDRDPSKRFTSAAEAYEALKLVLDPKAQPTLVRTLGSAKSVPETVREAIRDAIPATVRDASGEFAPRTLREANVAPPTIREAAPDGGATKKTKRWPYALVACAALLIALAFAAFELDLFSEASPPPKRTPPAKSSEHVPPPSHPRPTH